jgi:apolipoprotein N-acyltransferase
VRASGAGPTRLIDPYGRVLGRDVLSLVPGLKRPLTFYVRHGEVVPRLALVVLGAVYALRTLRRIRVRTPGRGT